MLYIVATPIGNLEDMTLRGIRILKEVNYIFAEDTRVTKKLLNHFEIENTVYRYDEHTKMHQIANVINLLKEVITDYVESKAERYEKKDIALKQLREAINYLNNSFATAAQKVTN